uniref:Uncharacterized protein n=1 Tax=Anopheles minimus TaxID=112268 RepID=A0A182WPP7_9DIPT
MRKKNKTNKLKQHTTTRKVSTESVPLDGVCGGVPDIECAHVVGVRRSNVHNSASKKQNSHRL